MSVNFSELKSKVQSWTSDDEDMVNNLKTYSHDNLIT